MAILLLRQRVSEYTPRSACVLVWVCKSFIFLFLLSALYALLHKLLHKKKYENKNSYGYIIGSMTDVVTSTSYVEHRLSERMDEVYAFLNKHPNFPKGLRKGLLKFYRNHFQQRRLIDEKELLQFLPSHLMRQVKHNVLVQGLNKIPFFRHLHEDLYPKVMSLIEPMTFLPGDIIMDVGETHHHPEFYILREGTCAPPSLFFTRCC